MFSMLPCITRMGSAISYLAIGSYIFTQKRKGNIALHTHTHKHKHTHTHTQPDKKLIFYNAAGLSKQAAITTEMLSSDQPTSLLWSL